MSRNISFNAIKAGKSHGRNGFRRTRNQWIPGSGSNRYPDLEEATTIILFRWWKNKRCSTAGGYPPVTVEHHTMCRTQSASVKYPYEASQLHDWNITIEIWV
jgi:hypothetical protein